MKSNKTYLYFAILAALLVAAYYITSEKGDKTSSYELKEKKFFELDSAKVDKIEIKYKEGDLVLSKSSGEWKAVSPYDYRVVPSLVEKAISSLKNFNLESIVSTNPSKRETYGFNDSNMAEISVYEGGSLKGKFIIGGSAAGTSSHVKKIDSDNIYIADNLDRTDFIKSSINEWRDKNIVSISKMAVNSVEFILPDETYIAKKDTSGRFFIGTDSAGKNFDGILNLLEKFATTNFKDSLLSEDTKFTDVINIDWGNKTTFKFLKTETTPAKYLLKVEGDKQLYELEEGYAKNLLKSKKEILGQP